MRPSGPKTRIADILERMRKWYTQRMAEPTFALAGDFPELDHAHWRTLAEAALKGAPFEKIVKTIGGLTVQPLYTGGPIDDSLPGQAPFVRGAKAARTSWDIRQVYRAPDVPASNRAILTDLERGVTSVELYFDRACRQGEDLAHAALVGDGLPVARVEDLQTLLAGVYDDLAPIGLHAGAAGGAAAALLFGLALDRGRGPSSYHAQLNLDPIGAWATDASGRLAVADGLKILTALTAYARTWSVLKVARADGAPYHEAGATDVDEIAAILATGVAYLETMMAAGLSPAEAARKLVLGTALDAELFNGIAKLRALRLTWARVLTAAGAEAALPALRIEASTSRAMMTRRDPWVNMLRGTVAAFAGAVGGADSMHVRPFDEAVRASDELAYRVARNTQIILQDESRLGQVIDPAAGAWYVEDLTRNIAEAAWSRFQAIQGAGGIVAALGDGSMQDRIESTWAEREKALARRKEAITGVSEFPNLSESPLVDRRPDPNEALRSLRAAVAARPDRVEWAHPLDGEAAAVAAVQAARDGATIDQIHAAWTTSTTAAAPLSRPLPCKPRAARYEALRDASDRYDAQHGHRPRVLLVKLGTVAEHTARVTFARNFFEAGGIEAIDAAPVDGPQAAADAIRAAPHARMAVLCGADDRYGAEVERIAPALKGHAIETLYLAGRPGDREAAFRAAGVDEFIFMGADVAAILERAMARVTTTAEGGAQ